MSKRRVSFGGVTVVGPGDGKNLPDQTESAPSASQDQQKPAKMRKNNKIIENSDFNFGTADQRAETQNFVNEKGTRMKTGLHTIDSDDEEENAINEKKLSYKKLDMEKVKGLEEDPEDDQDEDGNMITGFNLKDEMEEGEFDSTGQFHFKKREDTDHWLESVDWKKVRKDEKKDEAMEQETEKEDEKEQDTEKEILAKILAKMKPKETVTKTLQRLGKSSAGKIPAWKQKRMEKLARRKQAGKSDTSKYMIEEEEGETTGNAEELKTMTDLVDRLSRRGYYDVYTDTYEKIKHKLNTMDKSPGNKLHTV